MTREQIRLDAFVLVKNMAATRSLPAPIEEIVTRVADWIGDDELRLTALRDAALRQRTAKLESLLDTAEKMVDFARKSADPAPVKKRRGRPPKKKDD